MWSNGAEKMRISEPWLWSGGWNRFSVICGGEVLIILVTKGSKYPSAWAQRMVVSAPEWGYFGYFPFEGKWIIGDYPYLK